MPSGPPELHEYWGDDSSAVGHLVNRGFILHKALCEWEPLPYHIWEPDDWSAISYLILEWDWGGLHDRSRALLWAQSDARLAEPSSVSEVRASWDEWCCEVLANTPEPWWRRLRRWWKAL